MDTSLAQFETHNHSVLTDKVHEQRGEHQGKRCIAHPHVMDRKIAGPDSVWTTNEPGLECSQDLIESIPELEIPAGSCNDFSLKMLVASIASEDNPQDDLRKYGGDVLNITMDVPFNVTNQSHPAFYINLDLLTDKISLFVELSRCSEYDGGPNYTPRSNAN